MSKEQIKGMIGELIFMRDLLNAADFKIVDIIEAWQKMEINIMILFCKQRV